MRAGRSFLPASGAYLAYTPVRTGSSPAHKRTGDGEGRHVTMPAVTVSTDSMHSHSRAKSFLGLCDNMPNRI